MELTVDLHSHSGHAGGVGNISLAAVAQTMRQKGIQVFGTGDCLQPQWLEDLETLLKPAETGLFFLESPPEGCASARFCLQSEIIITCDVPSGGRKGTHVVLLFPGFAAAKDALKHLQNWGVKINMGRPFVKCNDAEHVAEFFTKLVAIDESILVIPAHVLTPQGIYGSDHPVERLADVFGTFEARIRAIETGLSADPEILALIPELDNRTLLSNSDCHSAALNRVGREYTVLQTQSISYPDIAEAIVGKQVIHTAEFNPAEGRYFLTGHRGGCRTHAEEAYCYFSPDCVPAGNHCPICGKSLTVGVLQRALEISAAQGADRDFSTIQPRQQAIHMVPLVEVIAAGLGVKSVASKKVTKNFHAVLEQIPTEAVLWSCDTKEIESRLGDSIPRPILEAILQVKRGEFTFEPLGFDGEYGALALGKQSEWFGHRVVQNIA